MGNFFKLKKRNIIITFLLIFNQLILSSYSLENKKIEISGSEENDFPSKYVKEFKKLISSKKQNETDLPYQESEDFEQYIEELEKFVEETFDSNDSDIYTNQLKQLLEINNNTDLLLYMASRSENIKLIKRF